MVGEKLSSEERMSRQIMSSPSVKVTGNIIGSAVWEGTLRIREKAGGASLVFRVLNFPPIQEGMV